MDPIVALANLRKMSQEVLDGSYAIGDEPAHEMAEQLLALDEWMSRGGFSPWAMPSPGEMETIEHFPGLR